jgi:hypothetical protein
MIVGAITAALADSAVFRKRRRVALFAMNALLNGKTRFRRERPDGSRGGEVGAGIRTA